MIDINITPWWWPDFAIIVGWCALIVGALAVSFIAGGLVSRRKR